MNLTELRGLFADVRCNKLYAKVLADNDNSKNQVYFGPDFAALNLFPNEGVRSDSERRDPIFKAQMRFDWLLPDGRVSHAPQAQLILYPQYPEVRFSGFLQGCAERPSDLMAARLAGRVLFLGVTPDRRVIGHVVGPNSEIAAEFDAMRLDAEYGVFAEVPLPSAPDTRNAKERLLAELRRIHLLGWIDSKQLAEDGSLRPCNAPQCGGFTLEAELGIPKNSRAEPDFLGWEVKQHAVSNFDRIEAGTITLMTPEPTGGLYRDEGPEAFIRRYGYPDRRDRPDRLNFGGVHRVGEKHAQTALKLELQGFNTTSGKIEDSGGAIALLSDRGDVAAMWHFAGLIEHWTRKHALAAYVPSRCHVEPQRQYSYGHTVRLGARTDFLRFLMAMSNGAVYYDPGLKLEHASSTRARVKRRNQFRIASRNIPALYESVETAILVSHD